MSCVDDALLVLHNNKSAKRLTRSTVVKKSSRTSKLRSPVLDIALPPLTSTEDKEDYQVERNEISENDSLLSNHQSAPDFEYGIPIEEDDNDERSGIGYLCILPPSVYSFIFGEITQKTK